MSISPKVIAAAVGAGAGGVVSTLVLWIVGTTAYGMPADAEGVAAAIAVVPTPVSGTILLLLTVVGSAIPGYQVTDPARDPGHIPAEVPDRGMPYADEQARIDALVADPPAAAAA